MNKLALTLFLLLCFLNTHSQEITPTPAIVRGPALELRNTIKRNSLIANIPFESIGPTIFSGRVSDIAVDPNDATRFYVAYDLSILSKNDKSIKVLKEADNGIIYLVPGDYRLIVRKGAVNHKQQFRISE